MESIGYADSPIGTDPVEATVTAGSGATGAQGPTGAQGEREVPRIVDRVAKALGTDHVNVAGTERLVSLGAGAVLALYGAKRKDWVGGALALVGAVLVERGATGHCAVYQAVGMNTAEGAQGGVEQQHGRSAILDASKSVKVERAVTIDAAPDELYRFWRNFENLPRIMDHLESVTVIDETHSHWKAKAPAGTSVEWDAVINNEVANELIAWKSVEGATVPNAGSVHFTPAPGNRGTVVKVVLEYQPPAGKLGAMVAKLFGEEPDVQVREDLRRFKATMETGETPTVDGQTSGRGKTA